MIDRPLCIATICYIIGIIMGLYLSSFGIVFLLCFLLLIIAFKINKKICIYILIIIIGFSYIKFIDYSYEKNYDLVNSKENYIIEGIVVSDKRDKEYKEVYDLDVKKIDGIKIEKSKKYLLNIKKSKEMNIKFGDYIKINAKIEQPSKARNYMGFDYQRYLKSKKIIATIIDVENVEILDVNKANIAESIFNSVRNNIKKIMYKLLPKDARALVGGMMIGDKEELDANITENFKNSNLTHMLEVSGAHISYVILGLNLMLKKTSNRFRKIFIICFLIFFVGVTDFTPSVQRASIMAILLLISTMLYRSQDTYTSIAFSGLVILIINPYSFFDVGFQLSFGGTIGIVLMYNNLIKRFKTNGKLKDYIVSSVCVSVCANLIIIPIMAFNFNTVSLTFWISNLLAGPFLGVIIILGFCVYLLSFVIFPVAKIISIPLKYLTYILLIIVKYCSKIPFSSITIRTPYIFEILIYYIVLYLVFNYVKIKPYFKKLVVIILIAILIANSCIHVQNHGNMIIYFIDVGQGDSTLIRTAKNKTILIDGGGSENSSFDVGEKTLLPYLLDRKITVLDYVVISHFDTDHCGGILYLMEHIKVKNIIISKQGKESSNYNKFKNIVLDKGIYVIFVKKGDKIKIDNETYMDVLFPSNNLISDNILNNNSIVTKICYNNFSILFTGDVEEIAENEICSQYNTTNTLKANILKVAHHGSKTSSTAEFIKMVKPQIALIGVGEKNKFGHPNDGVIQRLKNMNTKIYRTDKMGEIVIQINNMGEVKISSQL